WLALVHGDLSPKNILTHPTTAILLDAECAWFGDPAFDLAFCLTHLLLKSRVRPDRAGPVREAAERLLAAPRSHLDWEPRTGSTSASPGSCPRCSSRGSTGRRRSSTSPSPATGPRSGRRPCASSRTGPAGPPTCWTAAWPRSPGREIAPAARAGHPNSDSRVIGSCRTRRPVALKTALAIAGATPTSTTSPSPFTPSGSASVPSLPT